MTGNSRRKDVLAEMLDEGSERGIERGIRNEKVLGLMIYKASLCSTQGWAVALCEYSYNYYY